MSPYEMMAFPAYADHFIKLLRHALNLAVEWELLEKNPAPVHLFNPDNKVEHYLKEDELKRLLRCQEAAPANAPFAGSPSSCCPPGRVSMRRSRPTGKISIAIIVSGASPPAPRKVKEGAVCPVE